MVKRCASYSVIQLVDMVCSNYKKYKSYSDLCDLENRLNNIANIDTCSYTVCNNNNRMPLQYPKECVSYSVFLQNNPGASKKQRVQAIQRFYDSLLSDCT